MGATHPRSPSRIVTVDAPCRFAIVPRRNQQKAVRQPFPGRMQQPELRRPPPAAHGRGPRGLSEGGTASIGRLRLAIPTGTA